MAGNAGDGGLFETVIKLVNLGFAGVGVVVLLLLFIILVRDAPATAATQKLRNRFLTWGMSFAFFCGVMAVIVPLTAPREGRSKPARMLLNFSPSFTTEGLPAPRIILPDGANVAPGASFEARDGQVLVSVDDALKNVATLKQTALALAETASSAQKQADSAVAALTASRAAGGGGAVAPPAVVTAQETAESASQDSQAATAAITTAIKTGRFDVLDHNKRVLNQATITTFRARNQVIRAVRQ